MKTKEVKQLEVKNYLTKANQHLFKNNKGEIFKVVPFEIDGVLHVAKITIKQDGTTESKIRKVFMWESDDIKQTWKNSFLYYGEQVAIKHFKDVRLFFYYLKDKLGLKNEDNVLIMNKIIKDFNLFSNLVDKK